MRLTLLVFLFPFLATAQIEDACAPSNLANEVMAVLSNMDKKDYQNYKSVFITGSELELLIEQLDVNEEAKAMIREERNQAFIDEMTATEFKDLVMEGETFQVDWKNIEYEEFLYKVRLQGGVKELRGELYFKDAEESYEVRIYAVFLEGEYHVLELNRFDISFELHGFPEGFEEHLEIESEEITADEAMVEAEEALAELEAAFDELEEPGDELRDRAINALFELYHALKDEDYDKAQLYLKIPDGASAAEINEQLPKILEKDELSLEGIEYLDKNGIFGMLEAMHGEWGTAKAERSGLNKDECYAIKLEGSNIECMFHWDGEMIRFFRVDNIRGE